MNNLARGMGELMRITLASVLAGLALVGLSVASESQAAVKRSINIPAQGLGSALVMLEKDRNLEVIFVAEDIRDVRTQGAVGEFTSEETLRRLLIGTGLTFRFIDERTITILPERPENGRGVTVNAQEADGIRTNLATSLGTQNDSQGPQNPSPGTGEGARSADEGNKTDENPDKDSSDAEIEVVVVTGTNIRGTAPAGSPPVLILDEKDILRSGYTSVDQVIQALPQNVRSGAEGATADSKLSGGSSAGFNLTGGSGVNLRGLGASATLTLINGKRTAASTSGGFTDISLIPLSAVERIEVLTDGASAIYGADAVAGVVNVVLKKDYQGAETRARYGVTAPGGRDEVRASQSLGHTWDTGSALAIVDYLNQSQLSSDERDFTSNVTIPTTIYPENKQLSAVLSATQRMGDKWSTQFDAQYADVERFAYTTSGTLRTQYPVDLKRVNSALGVTYNATPEWDISVYGTYSKEDIGYRQLAFFPGSTVPDPIFSQYQDQVQEEWSGNLVASGTVFELPAGSAGMAFGATHRSEEYLRKFLNFDFTEPASRDVNSAFVEFHIPLIGAATTDNAAASTASGLQRLVLSVAARYDDYSDFGDTVNPKVGIAWAPWNSLQLRASYSTSFRAPAIGRELASSSAGANMFVSTYSYATADGTGTLPVLYLAGSNELEAEEARNWTVGFTFRPTAIQGLQIGFTYYDIRYDDRIVLPPFDQGALSNPALQSFLLEFDSPAELQAFISEATAGRAVYDDSTGPDFGGGEFGPEPWNITTTLYDGRLTNAGVVDTSGFDLTIDYRVPLADGAVTFGLNGNRIDKIETVFAPGAPTIDFAGTTGNPSRTRLRGTVGLERNGCDTALAINHTGKYTDTSGIVDRSAGSFTTVDATFRYTFANGVWHGGPLSLAFSVINAFDRSPPFVTISGPRGANYDSANADPLGRMIALEISKRWQ